jgi:hypothetical protein
MPIKYSLNQLRHTGFLYHYTAWAKLPAVVPCGELRPSAACAPGEKPLLWFSANQVWEPTATKLLQVGDKAFRMSFEQMVDRFGAVRFGLRADDARLLDWRSACRFAGTPSTARKSMEKVGLAIGANPAHWFAVKTALALSELSFEVWGDGRWHRADPAAMAQVWSEVRGGITPRSEVA